jgi:transposase
MFRRKDPAEQSSFWIPTSELPATPVNTFYHKLDGVLAETGFGNAVRELCAPFYVADVSRGGRPGIDPEVYFKMLMVGFFENLPSERGIASRCADSLSIRAFLHYGLDEATPHHSSFTIIRQRLGGEIYEQVFELVLKALEKKKLLKGKRLGIDASVMEANASLASLKHRLTGEAYAEYVKKLAAAAGVDTSDEAAVRRFDRKRPGRKTSNDEWQNPHDPDAKVGRTKRGATRMIYKPEHVVDLETGAIVDADVRPGDEHDTDDLTGRLLSAEARMNRALGDGKDTERVEVIVADMGYFKLEEIALLQDLGFETVVKDPQTHRRLDKLPACDVAVIDAAKAAVQSQLGTQLARDRAEKVERSFEHVLDCGGARQTTLRGRENIRKRYLIQAACANLSLLMRHLFGVGTPKQALALAHLLLFTLYRALVSRSASRTALWITPRRLRAFRPTLSRLLSSGVRQLASPGLCASLPALRAASAA